MISRWIRVASKVVVVALLALAAPPAGAVTVEKVAGTADLALGQFDLGELGYVVEELFVSGTASSYRQVGELTNDGHWSVEPDLRADFRTRIVVVRPQDPAAFNGTVVTEWLNVTGGRDAAADWTAMHREILRGGYAFVGVSTQRVGVEGGGFSLTGASASLKETGPERYGSLVHPGDAFSYDMFRQVGRLLKDPELIAATGLPLPERVLAVGESQSAVFLTTYLNAIEPLGRVFDGYLVHSRFGGAAPLDGASLVSPGGLDRVRFRTDLEVPVLNIITETDLLTPSGLPGYFRARQPDNAQLRTWEIAGTAHADTYLFAAGAVDSGTAPIEVLAKLYAPAALPQFGLTAPINAAPQHHLVVMSALAHLDRWVRTGTPAPSAERLATLPAENETDLPSLALDENGNATGGIRTPWVDVPIWRLSGFGNQGGPLAFLVGTTEPFTPEVLARLYPGGRDDYAAKFRAAMAEAVGRGFILAADAEEMNQLAEAMYPDESP